MRAISWLKDLIASERGNVLVLGAAVLPLLIGSAGYAVDTIQLSVWKRQLQRAADSSSIAGAYALSMDDDTHNAVHRDLDKNRFPVLTQEEGIWVGPRLGFNRTVRVQLTATRSLPFMSIFTHSAATMVADATAALVDDGTFCMISLYDQEGAGIQASGNAQVSLKCGMKTNARGKNTITTNGSKTKITADPVASVGDFDHSNGFDSSTTFLPYTAAQADPFLGVTPPSIPSGCSTSSVLTPANVPTTSGTYCFGSINVKPSETLNLPANSTIIVNGGDVDFQGDVNAAHTAIVMTSASGAAGDVKINANANLNLSAPTSGDYKGMLFYRDRRAAYLDIKVNGGAKSKLEGALYFPTADLTFNGNSTMDVKCLQMVGRILKFSGGANIDNVCPTGSGAKAFQQTIVRLVG
ncbi:MAG: pilus assembly protein TadG-related protein [Allosphingosinicella sp.]